jgi:sulfur-oxidizing protein SoxY
VRRRDFLLFAAAPLAARRAFATPEDVAQALREMLGETKLQPGKVKLDLPPIAENGNSVPVTVTVDSPMTAAEHVRSIHLFAEQNPLPNVAHFHLGPRAGRPQVATRIRMQSSQRVHAVAVLSDGTAWRDSADILVTISACTDDLD